jgi:hypothetical protein
MKLLRFSLISSLAFVFMFSPILPAVTYAAPDPITLSTVSVGAQTGPALTAGVGGNVTYTITVTSTGNGSLPVALSISGSLPNGVSASFSPASLTMSNGQSSQTSDLTLTTTNAAVDGSHNFTVQGVGDVTKTAGGTLIIDPAEVDETAPVISEVTPVATPSEYTTPDYTFTTDEAGTITYGGSCLSDTTEASVGNNTVTFNTLSPDTYTDCTITVTDAASNVSDVLDVNDFTISEATPPTTNNPITQPATNITTSDATLNATNGIGNATGHSFWVSTSTFLTTSPTIPEGVYSTPDLGSVDANTAFSALLSSVTTNGVPSNMPAITPDTTYYFAAWSYVDGTWYPGEILNFPTLSEESTTTPPETATLTIIKNTVGGDDRFEFSITGDTTATTSINTASSTGSVEITLNAGTSTVYELDKAGWDLISIDCEYDGESIGNEYEGGEQIYVDGGDHVTCTFTNALDIIVNDDGSVSGTKFNDANGNESYDEGEVGIAGWTVTLTGGSLEGGATTTTDSNGQYYFSGLSDGSYTVCEVPQDGWSQTYPNEGSACANGTLGHTVNISENSDLFNKDFGNKQDEITVPEENNDNDRGGRSGSRRRSVGSVLGVSFGGGQVLGANMCAAGINTYMRQGMANNKADVQKLQGILNEEVNAGLPITGFFGPLTNSAVQKFQLKYAEKVLAPWGITAPTGYVYKLTLWWINTLLCPSNAPAMPTV